jgi:hypothetical protein
MSTKESLKAQAFTMFSPELASAVAANIDEHAAVAATRSIATLGLGDHFYGQVSSGLFSGNVGVIWNGVEEFVYVPAAIGQFAFKRSGGRTITPRKMDTDGGSIPRLLGGFSSKFSSWGYAPAFMIHDWLFTAHKCGFAPDTDWTLDDAAMVMAEGIKTLMDVGYINYYGQKVVLPKDEDTLYLMYLAVKSFIAEKAWKDTTTVICRT